MPEDPNPSHAFTSWKEIAQHFGREVRTVQRWEKEEGLPIHRHAHQRRASVYAYPEELDAWWRDRGAHLPEPVPEVTARPLWPRLLLTATALAIAAAGLALLWKKDGRAPNPDSAALTTFRAFTFDATRPQGRMGEVLTGDLNGDGKQDLVAIARDGGEVYILLGRSLEYARSELPAAASVVITVSSRFESYGSQVGDFNGDGIDDLLLNEAWTTEERYHATAPLHLVWGRREWPARLQLPQAANVTLRFNWGTDARTGPCLRSGRAGDLNHDGIEDIFLGSFDYGDADGRDAHGVVSILFGRRRWPKELEVKAAAAVTIRGSQTGEGFGSACALGDFNSDGRADLAVHANETTLWYRLGGRGKQYIFLGREIWPARLDAKTDFDFRVDGTRRRSSSTMEFADVNGDGLDDLVVEKNSDEKTTLGEVHIWFGGPERKGIFSTDAADVIISGSAPGGRFGSAMAKADLDGDGFADLLVTEPFAGRVYLFFGRREWKKRGKLEDYAPLKLFEGESGAGVFRITPGDLDGDGLPELLFAAPEAGGSGREQAGRAWVVKPYLPVRVDLKPEDSHNVILYPLGKCAAQVYGFSRNERDQINPASIRLAGAAPEDYVVQDYNGDGIPDVQAYFTTGNLKVKPETKSIQLTARTRAGVLVGGTDSVDVVLSPPNQVIPGRPTGQTRHAAPPKNSPSH
jgi:hypothetical protein